MYKWLPSVHVSVFQYPTVKEPPSHEHIELSADNSLHSKKPQVLFIPSFITEVHLSTNHFVLWHLSLTPECHACSTWWCLWNLNDDYDKNRLSLSLSWMLECLNSFSIFNFCFTQTVEITDLAFNEFLFR